MLGAVPDDIDKRLKTAPGADTEVAVLFLYSIS
jgi:hypothetical protein